MTIGVDMRPLIDRGGAGWSVMAIVRSIPENKSVYTINRVRTKMKGNVSTFDLVSPKILTFPLTHNISDYWG